MKIQTIIEIAEDAIIADLCVKWYLSESETQKDELFNQIQEFYNKINKK